MEFVYLRYLKIFGLDNFLRYVPSVGPVHEDFVVPVRISIYLSSNHYIAILALSGTLVRLGYLVIMVRFVYPGGYRSRIPGLSWLGLYIQEDKGVGYLVYHG